MPLGRLFCEGVERGLDAALIRRLLPANVRLEPRGNRQGVLEAVIHGNLPRRDPQPTESDSTLRCYGVIDRDFDDLAKITDWDIPLIEAWQGAVGEPLEWKNAQDYRYGWMWERKEIENYLIDPDIVAYAFDLSSRNAATYRSRLNQAADAISVYQAARLALSQARIGMSSHSVKNKWGTKRVKDHEYPERNQLEESACRTAIQQIYAEFSRPVRDTDWTLALFDQWLPEFRPGGKRRDDFLTTYAGKDLLAALAELYPGWGIGNLQEMRTEQLCEETLKRLVSKGFPEQKEWKEFARQVARNYQPSAFSAER